MTSEDGRPAAKILKTLDYDEMKAMPKPQWLVDGVLVEGTSALLFGKSNAFKTFLSIDLALSVATGRSWHGHAVKQAKVLFVTTEGAKGFGRLRVPGWFNHHEVPRQLRDAAMLYPQEISLDKKDHVDILIATLKHFGTGLLVLDIFGGTMEGKETEDTTAREWVRATQRIIREAGTTILTVAHTGWQDQTRARMHSHFWGSFDSRMKVEGDKEKRSTVLTVERHKDADSTGSWGFRLEPTFDTLVPVLDDNPVQQAQHWTQPERNLLAALESAIADSGAKKSGTGWPDCPVVPCSRWKDAAIAAGFAFKSAPPSQKTEFNRARRKLREAGLIAEFELHAWPLASGSLH